MHFVSRVLERQQLLSLFNDQLQQLLVFLLDDFTDLVLHLILVNLSKINQDEHIALGHRLGHDL